MSIDIITPTVATVGGGFFGGLLFGFAIKKVVKLIAIVVGLFLGGLAYRSEIKIIQESTENEEKQGSDEWDIPPQDRPTENAVRYFASKFGKDLLDKMMLAYIPGMLPIERNLDLLIKIFGIYIVLSFIETARPISLERGRGKMPPSKHDELISSCLQNIIRVDKMFGYFMSIFEYLMGDNYAKNHKYNIDKIYKKRAGLSHLRHDRYASPSGKLPSAVELSVMRDMDLIKKNESMILAYDRKINQLKNRDKYLEPYGAEDYLSITNENEVDTDKLQILSKALSKLFPGLYEILDSFYFGFKNNPKQQTIDLSQTSGPLFTASSRSGEPLWSAKVQKRF